LENGLGRLFTYGVDVVEGELTMFPRNVVQLVAMVKQQPLRYPHGEPETFVGIEFISSS
jgi:hypothetical protein